MNWGHIVASYCAEPVVAIEIEGNSPAAQPDYDRQRMARLNQRGKEVIWYAKRETVDEPQWRPSGLFKVENWRTKSTPLIPLVRGTSKGGVRSILRATLAVPSVMSRSFLERMHRGGVGRRH